MEPITREEYYLAKIAGTYEGNTPEPVTIEEYYLATMAGDYSGNTPQPVTRLQYYMAKVAGVWGGSIPAPVTRLEYYWAAIASGEGKVFPPVTREEHFLVLVADAYSVVLTVVTGNPALLENSKGNRGLESLTLYGKSTQVSTTGAQLLPFEVGEKREGLEVFKDGIAISGARKDDIYAVGRSGMVNESSYDDFPLLASGEYYVYSDSASVHLFVVAFRNGINITLGSSMKGVAAKIKVMDGDKFRIFLRTAAAFKGKVKAMITRTPMNATSYEPYKPVQKLIVPTPNGLPGIPVSSGGNYTDEKGQQWVCDEVDFKKGVYVQRIAKYISSGGENLIAPSTRDGVDQYIIAVKSEIDKNFLSFGFSNKFKCKNMFEANTFTVTDMFIYFRFAENTQTPETIREVLNGCEFWYVLATPIETPLSSANLAAYSALRTYSPTTTVINDAGAGMSVGYAKMK